MAKPPLQAILFTSGLTNGVFSAGKDLAAVYKVLSKGRERLID